MRDACDEPGVALASDLSELLADNQKGRVHGEELTEMSGVSGDDSNVTLLRPGTQRAAFKKR